MALLVLVAVSWLMDLLSRPGAAEASHELQGTFKQLLNPDAFVKLIYSGLSAKEAQQLPRSLKVSGPSSAFVRRR